jgi:FkbM family methyltransferase
MANTHTYNTKYGNVTLLKNEAFIGNDFRQNKYWDEDTLIKLKEYIDPNCNILEIGGHCGTSSLVYQSYISENNKLFVYEPQNVMYQILVQNITQNNLQHKIVPFNQGVFCYNGTGSMNKFDLDGGGGIVELRYTQETDLGCNFGGIGLGKEGEPISLTTIDEMEHDNIGFIHCDAQGSENFIFSSAKETLKKYRPVVYYENNEKYAKMLYNNVCSSYPTYSAESKFDVTEYCMKELNYTKFIEKFNGGIDTLLLP